MRIDKLELRNFKKFREATFDFPRLVAASPEAGSLHILVGKNGMRHRVAEVQEKRLRRMLFAVLFNHPYGIVRDNVSRVEAVPEFDRLLVAVNTTRRERVAIIATESVIEAPLDRIPSSAAAVPKATYVPFAGVIGPITRLGKILPQQRMALVQSSELLANLRAARTAIIVEVVSLVRVDVRGHANPRRHAQWIRAHGVLEPGFFSA
jgi:hypothetical protein